MTDKTWLDYLTVIGTVATPVLVLALSAVGWRVKHQIERRLALEQRLREDRVNIYKEIVEPFIIFFTTDAAWANDPANKGRNRQQVASSKLLSLGYRQLGFHLSLVGSDAVVTAYNDLMQFFFGKAGTEEVTEDLIRQMMSLFGRLLLEIRRSMGNEATKLDNWAMLEWFLADACRYRGATESRPDER